MRRRFWPAIHIALVLAVVLVLHGGCSTPSDEDVGTAIIVDQLHSIQPNSSFISRTIEALETRGFQVDLYQRDDVTVDFYRKLPAHKYRLIIFRVHSGILLKEGEVAEGTWLFTNELHSPMKYVNERLAGSIVKARTAENKPWLFAIGSKFVTNDMEGQFDDTIIIMMGCYALYHNDLAQAFTQKGASVYIGWDGNLGLDYVDRATMILIQNLCTNNMTIKQAIEETMAEVGTDPDWDAHAGYYPAKSGNKIITQLLNLQ